MEHDHDDGDNDEDVDEAVAAVADTLPIGKLELLLGEGAAVTNETVSG